MTDSTAPRSTYDRARSYSHEEAADIIVGTLALRFAHITRAELLILMRAHYPSTAELNAFLRMANDEYLALKAAGAVAAPTMRH